MPQPKLPEHLSERIVELKDAAIDAVERGDREQTVALLDEAWDLIPEPKQWWGHPTGLVLQAADLLPEVGAHEEALRWIPRGRQAYGESEHADLMLSRFHVSFLFHAGHRAEAEALAREITDRYGPFAVDDEEARMALLGGPPSPPDDEGDEEDDDDFWDDVEEPEVPEETQAELDRLVEVGKALEADGDTRGALAVWEQAIDLVPDSHRTAAPTAWFHVSAADACLQLGEPMMAVPHLNAALLCEGTAENPYPHLRLAEALIKSGDEDAAVSSLRTALDLHPDILDHADPTTLALAARRALAD